MLPTSPPLKTDFSGNRRRLLRIYLTTRCVEDAGEDGLVGGIVHSFGFGAHGTAAIVERDSSDENTLKLDVSGVELESALANGPEVIAVD